MVESYFLNGCKLGGGVLYSMFVTASSAVLDLGRSMAGRGGGRERWVRLYSSAEVESSIGLGGTGGFMLSSLKRVGLCENDRTASLLEDSGRRRNIVVAAIVEEGSIVKTESGKGGKV